MYTSPLIYVTNKDPVKWYGYGKGLLPALLDRIKKRSDVNNFVYVNNKELRTTLAFADAVPNMVDEIAFSGQLETTDPHDDTLLPVLLDMNDGDDTTSIREKLLGEHSATLSLYLRDDAWFRHPVFKLNGSRYMLIIKNTFSHEGKSYVYDTKGMPYGEYDSNDMYNTSNFLNDIYEMVEFQRNEILETLKEGLVSQTGKWSKLDREVVAQDFLKNQVNLRHLDSIGLSKHLISTNGVFNETFVKHYNFQGTDKRSLNAKLVNEFTRRTCDVLEGCFTATNTEE